MRRTKHVIAVVVVATALCADRSISAAPVVRAQSSGGIAKTFASKLANSLRRVVAHVCVQPARSDEQVQAFALPIHEAASGFYCEISPFQFRLPPPIC